jgi:hypothetical protein
VVQQEAEVTVEVVDLVDLFPKVGATEAFMVAEAAVEPLSHF